MGVHDTLARNHEKPASWMRRTNNIYASNFGTVSKHISKRSKNIANKVEEGRYPFITPLLMGGGDEEKGVILIWSVAFDNQYNLQVLAKFPCW